MMKYQKIINLLHNRPNQPTKFRTKNWVEINEDARGTYNTNSPIKLKNSQIKLRFCDYNDVYIHASGAISLGDISTVGAAANNTIKEVIFKECAPFTDCINKIYNTQVDNAKDIDIVMQIHSLIEYIVII